MTHLYRLGSLIQHFPVTLGSWNLCWSLGLQTQSKPCPRFLTKLKKGGSLADIDPWTGLLFCPIFRPSLLCPVSGHCVPERQGGLVDLLGTLSKFLTSLASLFLEGSITSLPEHRLYHYSDLHPCPVSPVTVSPWPNHQPFLSLFSHH